MLFKLAQSPFDPQRVYVLAVLRPDNPQAARASPGLYTSADAGKTWRLAAAASRFPVSSIFTIGAGGGGPGEVYVVLPALADHGVYVSSDAGQTWRALPVLPTTDPSGVLGVPAPGGGPAHQERLFLWSISSGLFESDDGGATWIPASGITGGIFAFSQAGTTFYADWGQRSVCVHGRWRAFPSHPNANHLLDSGSMCSSPYARLWIDGHHDLCLH